MYDLSGKVALVTGAARKRGIGHGIALRLAQEGADVAVNDILKTPEDLDPWDKEVGWRGLDSIVAEIKSLGRKSLAITADVSKSQDVDNMVRKVVDEFGKIDILVNNAALLSRELGTDQIVDLSEEIWNKAIAVNLTGVFLMSRAVARQMIKQGQGGKIINFSSRGGKQPNPNTAAYCATKAGVINFTQSLAQELGQYKINANAVCPGPCVSWGSSGKKIYQGIKQGLSENEAILKAYGNEIIGPLGRLVQVADVVNVVAFLASNQSDYMTGQAINITGGRVTMR
jgi:3-oxoacyl-[acyl-carrier protein] reductase/meso-butanediol dehydrogenase/(S,S)-butanediol dehydrogenase/diacetyl reductase